MGCTLAHLQLLTYDLHTEDTGLPCPECPKGPQSLHEQSFPRDRVAQGSHAVGTHTCRLDSGSEQLVTGLVSEVWIELGWVGGSPLGCAKLLVVLERT